MTVHAAKGEEWDAVVIPGAELYSGHNSKQMAEERRLFFVAVTRARKHLTVTCARLRHTKLNNGQIVTSEREPGELFEVVANLRPIAV